MIRVSETFAAAPFSVHLTLYKDTQVNKTSRKHHGTGILLDDASRAILWSDGTVSHLGPAAVHHDRCGCIHTHIYKRICVFQ